MQRVGIPAWADQMNTETATALRFSRLNSHSSHPSFLKIQANNWTMMLYCVPRRLGVYVKHAACSRVCRWSCRVQVESSTVKHVGWYEADEAFRLV